MVSSHTSSNKNAESNHETYIPDNFFEGVEDYWKSFGINKEDICVSNNVYF